MSRLSDLERKVKELEDQAKRNRVDTSLKKMTDEEIISSSVLYHRAAELGNDELPIEFRTGPGFIPTLINLLPARGDRPFMLDSTMFRDRDEMDLIAEDIRECAPDGLPVIEWLVIRGDGSTVWEGEDDDEETERVPAPEYWPPEPQEDTITPPPPENIAVAPLLPSVDAIDERDPPLRSLPPVPMILISGGNLQDIIRDEERPRSGPLTKDDFKRLGMW